MRLIYQFDITIGNWYVYNYIYFAAFTVTPQFVHACLWNWISVLHERMLSLILDVITSICVI